MANFENGSKSKFIYDQMVAESLQMGDDASLAHWQVEAHKTMTPDELVELQSAIQTSKEIAREHPFIP